MGRLRLPPATTPGATPLGADPGADSGEEMTEKWTSFDLVFGVEVSEGPGAFWGLFGRRPVAGQSFEVGEVDIEGTNPALNNFISSFILLIPSSSSLHFFRSSLRARAIRLGLVEVRGAFGPAGVLFRTSYYNNYYFTRLKGT